MEMATLKLHGITDSNAANLVNGVLSAINGVRLVRVAQAESKAMVQYDERQVSSEQLQAALAQAGIRAEAAASGGGGCCGGCGGGGGGGGCH